MATARMRPTFTMPLAPDRDQAIEEIRERLESDARFAGRWMARGDWAELYLPNSERRFWSPHLTLRLEASPRGSTLFGRFAPDPEVWTFFMFLYFGITFLVVLGGVFGWAQWASGESAWGLWAVWVGLPAIGLIHLAGALGQRLGYDQMVVLRHELDDVVRGLEVDAVIPGTLTPVEPGPRTEPGTPSDP